MQCPKCQGKGFIEYEHGLIQVGCDECNGTGEIDGNPKYLIIPEALPGKTIDETADVAREIIKASKETDDSDSGTRQPDKSIGSANPSKSRKPQKQKAGKKTTKRDG